MQNRMVLMMPEQSCIEKRHGHSQHISLFLETYRTFSHEHHCSRHVMRVSMLRCSIGVGLETIVF